MRIEYLEWINGREEKIISNWIKSVRSSPNTVNFSNLEEAPLRRVGSLIFDLWSTTNFNPDEYIGCDNCREFIKTLKEFKAETSEAFTLLLLLQGSIIKSFFEFAEVKNLTKESLEKSIKDVCKCVIAGTLFVLQELQKP